MTFSLHLHEIVQLNCTIKLCNETFFTNQRVVGNLGNPFFFLRYAALYEERRAEGK